MTALWLANVVAYSLQLAAIVATTLIVSRLLPIHDVRWRLRLWQGVFAIAVLLPLVQLWIRSDMPAPTSALFVMANSDTASTIGNRGLWLDALAVVLTAGIVIRLVHLALGYLVIRRYVDRATPLNDAGSEPSTSTISALCAVRADVRLSHDVRTPATVGVWRAVILVPPSFLALPPRAQRAVLLHESLHVRRRDWLRMVMEEIWCAVLWFHPLARVLVSRLDLAREMVVDWCVINETADRPAYAKALLAFTDDRSSLRTMTPFIRPSHLSQRIAALSQEVSMSRRLTLATVVVMGLMVTTATGASLRFVPMTDAQDTQDKRDSDVTLPKPISETKPQYTAAAMQEKIEGTVLLAIVVEANGTVGVVKVTKSLDAMYGLDEEAIRAARQWRFEPGRKDGKPVPVEVTLEFRFTLRN